MQEINDNMFLENQQEDMIYKHENQMMKEKSIEDIQVIKNIKETKKNEEIDEKIAKFLREKDLDENLIETLINIGLTDEHIRLLKTLNLNEDDINNLQDLWQAKINKSNDSIINSTSGSLSSNGLHEQLSSNSIYLKRILSKPLIQALCEIITKKPADPVEYLGHWLFHYKIYEERAIQQKERELELSIREELILKQYEDKDAVFDEQKDEEEKGED
ncbi:DYDC2 protein, partial [Acromyrmex charruanus]